MALVLKQLLVHHAISIADLARGIEMSKGSTDLLLRWGHWPRNKPQAVLEQRIRDYCIERGLTADELDGAFALEPDTTAPREPGPVPPSIPAKHPPTAAEQFHRNPDQEDHPQEPQMLLRKHTLTPEAKKHFRLVRDPFTDEMLEEADVFVSPDIRYVRAAMRQTARHGGMLAVIAESGGGKSTLVADMVDWINTSAEPIAVIAPYVLGTGGSGRSSRPLTADDLIRAVFRGLSPGAPVPQNAQRRADVMHSLLEQSNKVGRRHVLVIEEAHDLSVQTIKALKRFYELQTGFKKLLSIILIGQTELEWKLSEHNAEVREVVQRCEKVHLPPLDDEVEAYLRHKLQRSETAYDEVFAADAADEIRTQLRTTVAERVAGGRRVAREASLCYPLAVNNLVSAAMNAAQRIGAPRVTAELVKAAVRAA